MAPDGAICGSTCRLGTFCICLKRSISTILMPTKQPKKLTATAEYKRLARYRQRHGNWKRWGPYLSERAWGTVREDYSQDGDAWSYFPHDAARSRAYRWNEDGLCGISDRNQYLCLGIGLWNHQDPILKERLFGLTGPEGNHGEDVKEYYFYQVGTPTNSFMQMLYKYPQQAYPYEELVQQNAQRGIYDDEFELLDTGVFAKGRYFDVGVTYFKAGENDICGQVEVTNRGSMKANCEVLVQLWFRNTWSWGYPEGPMRDVPERPRFVQIENRADDLLGADVFHPMLGRYYFYAELANEILFTENETNRALLFNQPNGSPYVKDAFHAYVVQGDKEAVNPNGTGTKTAALFHVELEAGQSRTLRFRLTQDSKVRPFINYRNLFTKRCQEKDEYYAALLNPDLEPWAHQVEMQAYAGLLWSKQLYYFDVNQWLEGDPGKVNPPPGRQHGRNRDWRHLHNFDLISMPDKWEYPWYAAWDLAFHCLPLARLDPDFAKRQLELLTREWYMHPNGQIPAYEWRFDDANPPVHAWATRRVYLLDKKLTGKGDLSFLKRVFHKLLLNFTWWVNRKDQDGNNVFQGGFLGLDNISLLDRSAEIPQGGHLEQADGTAWMSFFAMEMMKIALILAAEDRSYIDLAAKFYEHFLRIAAALNGCSESSMRLWDEEDGFYYDLLHLPRGDWHALRVRSVVGLLPLLATTSLNHELLDKFPGFKERIQWFNNQWPELVEAINTLNIEDHGEHHLVSMVTPDRLRRILGYMLDEKEFLSPYGIRSLSQHHLEHPFNLMLNGHVLGVGYEPGESRSHMYGGNSNWRGPIWFPINFLLLEALEDFHAFLGPSFKVEFPTDSGRKMNLQGVARTLARRLIRLFKPDKQGRKPFQDEATVWYEDPAWRDQILFFEYFHAESGQGLGANHQTGWTALVAELIQEYGIGNSRR